VVLNELLADYYRLPLRAPSFVGAGARGPATRRPARHGGDPGDGERRRAVFTGRAGCMGLAETAARSTGSAPANVPQLSRFVGKPLPVAAHDRPSGTATAAAQCHRRIDPIGYGLEHFDAAGLWRNGGTHRAQRHQRVAECGLVSIDATGVLPDGTSFDGFAGLRGRRGEARIRLRPRPRREPDRRMPSAGRWVFPTRSL